MPASSVAVERALEAVGQGCGRTVAISGPPVSGKSELLQGLQLEASRLGWRTVALHGSYRDRTTPYAALADFGAAPSGSAPVGRPDPEGAPGEVSPWAGGSPFGIAAGLLPGDVPASSRSRRGRGDVGAAHFGPAGGGARRSGRVVTGPDVFHQLVRWTVEGDGRPLALLVEDASLFDTESREAILYASQRIRRRPVLLAVALDVALPAYRAWEEQLIGRGDVDWVRIAHAKPDPRETEQVQESFRALPDGTQRLLVFLALLGGSTTEVGLGRAAKLGVRDLAEALAPAAAVNLVKAEEGRVAITYSSWVGLVPTFASETLRADVHRQIAEAISALNPEPDSKRGRELATHLFEARSDASALRPLLEAAEFSERLGAFDDAEELFDKALKASRSLTGTERAEAELEIRIWRARALILSGRVAAGEKEAHDVLVWGAAEGLSADLLRGRVEELFPALRAIGPRPSLLAGLEELVERLGEVPAQGAQTLLECLVAEKLLEQGHLDEARMAGIRAQDLSRRATSEASQSTGQIVEAIVLANEAVPFAGPRGPFTDPLGNVASRVAHPPLEQMASELWLRWVERARHPTETLAAFQRAIPLLQRSRAITTELFYQLAIAEMSLDRRPSPKALESLQRSRELADAIHLALPSTAVARLWLLEGRWAVDENRPDGAREAWSALADLPATVGLPAYRAEAMARSFLLESAEGRQHAADEAMERLSTLAATGPLPSQWRFTRPELLVSVRESRRGAGALPTRGTE